MYKEINIFAVFNNRRVIRSFLLSNLTIAYAEATMGVKKLLEIIMWKTPQILHKAEIESIG